MDSDYLIVAYNTTVVNTSIKLESPVWNYIALVFQNQSGGASVDAYHGRTLVSSSDLTINLTPGPLSAIYLAGGPDEAGSGGELLDQQFYVGLIQDVGLYSRPLTSDEISSLAMGAISLFGASFLPQCLCPAGQMASNDMQTCEGESGAERYAQEMQNNIVYISLLVMR